ncbi:hypothetical protein DXT94_04040 [Rhizobium sp. ICMP 5592]|nr:hypothetical protein [Rhizobium sp. ICMP 5592]
MHRLVPFIMLDRVQSCSLPRLKTLQAGPTWGSQNMIIKLKKFEGQSARTAGFRRMRRAQDPI